MVGSVGEFKDWWVLFVDMVGELGVWWGVVNIVYVGGSMGKCGG